MLESGIGKMRMDAVGYGRQRGDHFMAIITISRGSYSKGKEVAEKVAEKLGYQSIAREVLIGASNEFNVPEVKFARAMHDDPSLLDRLTHGKEKYAAYFEAAFLRHMKNDNVVYHGLAGHFFLRNISHALKVRITASIEDRARTEMERKGESMESALASIRKNDEERRKWSLHIYGIDTSDPSLYDVVIDVKKITTDDAAEIICHTAGLDTFKTTFESQRAIEDLAMAAEVRARLVNLKPDIQVTAREGKVLVGTKSVLIREPSVVQSIEAAALSIPGVMEVEVKIDHLVDWND